MFLNKVYEGFSTGKDWIIKKFLIFREIQKEFIGAECTLVSFSWELKDVWGPSVSLLHYLHGLFDSRVCRAKRPSKKRSWKTWYILFALCVYSLHSPERFRFQDETPSCVFFVCGSLSNKQVITMRPAFTEETVLNKASSFIKRPPLHHSLYDLS